MLHLLLLMLIAMSLIPMGDAAAKLMSTTMGADPLFVAWSRFALGTLLILPFAPRESLTLLKDWRIWLRASFIMVGIVFIQFALKLAPIADVFGAFFVGPPISVLLSALFLKERIGPRQIGLVALGFLGVLLVTRPGFDMNPGLFFALMAGLCYGGFLTASKWLGQAGSARALLVTQLVITAICLAPLGITRVPEMTPALNLEMLASAAFSLLGNLLLQYAYSRHSAGLLAPLVYFQLLAATVLGIALFGTLPAPLTWVGLALILAAGMLSPLLSRATTAPAPAARSS